MRIVRFVIPACLVVLILACGGPSGPDPLEQKEAENLAAADTVQQFLSQAQKKLAKMLGDKAITEPPLQVLKAADFDSKYVGRPVAWTGKISDSSVEPSLVMLMISFSEGNKVYRISARGSEVGMAVNKKVANTGGWVVFTGTLDGRDGEFLQTSNVTVVAAHTEGPEAKSEEFWTIAEQAAETLK